MASEPSESVKAKDGFLSYSMGNLSASAEAAGIAPCDTQRIAISGTFLAIVHGKT